MEMELYTTLGVSSQASQAEIKTKYRHLALKYHPDKNIDAGDRFKDISFAYNILKDPEKRSFYDSYGMEGLKSGSTNKQNFTFPKNTFTSNNHFNSHQGSFSKGFQFNNHETFFNKGRRSEGDIVIHLKVTLEDLYQGKWIPASFQKQIACTNCKGVGTPNLTAVIKCPCCDGAGIKTFQFGTGLSFQTVFVICSMCLGTKRVIARGDLCKLCKGNKYTIENMQAHIWVEKGMRNGMEIRMTGHGHIKENGVSFGDLICILQEEKHPRFDTCKNEARLQLKQKITRAEVNEGFYLEIERLDGSILAKYFSPGYVEKKYFYIEVKNEGMPLYNRPGEKGSLFIDFDLVPST